mmetsp:Transcript_24474/g.52739  ORF Transcript_24474/g.52739 Transcript_24474/m.52739 type:complete len:489 (+) Transcript_24474:191-1657(+)|eukprot:CAMPEP_0172305794 /NCGR_PEP_ID=MMETSP1058-20130122/7020_1 /TAXON_ID=83371 /ORGANISM="Detonula confervacea, Strain CCMP 353" /LENGTH=488 /DNA_ID=CAMNT_0013017503 /DNA_START=125 /DNA_END=1591 /DNA_ORIENTATION=+
MSDNWFDDRAWSISGNKEGESLRIAKENYCKGASSSGRSVVLPKSTHEISQLLLSNPDAAIAVVCGGHSSSNVSTWPFLVPDGDGDDVSKLTIILDMKHMSSVSVNKETNEATVGGGVLFRQLAESCAKVNGALPIGTGATVGVCGYVLNGGISGYFGRRLGMLGQRVTSMEIVLANGDINILSPESIGEDGKLFRACLGAGSAMGVVTSLTLKMEDDSSFKTGGSLVCACANKTTAKPFLEKALRFLNRYVLPSPSTSMEIVITSDFTVICSFMFFDSFDGVPADFVQPLRDGAQACNVPVVADYVSSHKSWFDAASSLWEVIAGMKGNPLVRMDHCIGTHGTPSDQVVEFLLDKWVGDFLEKAPFSLVEIRSLGGAASERNNLPTGNAKCSFFADMIVSYDASILNTEDKSSLLEEVHGIISEAKNQSGLLVDFSGTHCQSDDPAGILPSGDDIFGGRENHEFIRTTKRKYDPKNRFCFHPFTHLI